MKKNILIYLIFLFFNLKSYSQDSICISGQLINNTRYAKVVIKKFAVGTIDIGVFPIINEKFAISAPKDIEPGVYRFQFSQSESSGYIDIIIDGKEKEIDFKLDLNEEVASRIPVFVKSKENINWYQYQKENLVILQKIQALQQLITIYPVSTDKIVEEVQEVIQKEKNNYFTQESFFLKQNSNSWAGKMVENNSYYFTDTKEHWRLQEFYKKEHYWDKITTTDPQLINTPLYTELILEYLKYYMNPEMKFSEEEMNEGFINSVDIIMEKFRGNEETKKFALQYLQLGFKEIDNQKVLQYIDEKFKSIFEQCNDDATDKSDFEKRINGYAAMKVGSKAPNITFTTNRKSLYDISSEKTIVVFWASWCPHCREELPKLNEWALANPSTKVVAISLDDDKKNYETAIKQYPAIMHDTDLKKWEGKTVNDYYVYGTPTFIILDKEKKILEKLTSFEQLRRFFDE